MINLKAIYHFWKSQFILSRPVFCFFFVSDAACVLSLVFLSGCFLFLSFSFDFLFVIWRFCSDPSLIYETGVIYDLVSFSLLFSYCFSFLAWISFSFLRKSAFYCFHLLFSNSFSELLRIYLFIQVESTLLNEILLPLVFIASVSIFIFVLFASRRWLSSSTMVGGIIKSSSSSLYGTKA